jgi:hypothetical protein
MNLNKKEGMFVIIGVFILIAIAMIFFIEPKIQLSRPCGSCTPWEDRVCGGGMCGSLEMEQGRLCVYDPTLQIHEIPIQQSKLSEQLKNGSSKEKSKPLKDSEEVIEEVIEKVIEEKQEDKKSEKSDTSSSKSRPDIGSIQKPKSITWPHCIRRCVVREMECNTPPSEPAHPTPEPQEGEVPLVPTLTWISSDIDESQELEYDLYFGINSTRLELLESTIKISQYNFKEELEYSTDYFWQISVSDGIVEVFSPIWKFKTESYTNLPPTIPNNPSPEEGVQEISLTPTLSWNSSDTEHLVYNLYFGEEVPILISENQSLKNYTFETELNYSTNYSWNIESNDGEFIVSGPVWRFTTISEEIINNPPSQPHNLTPENNSQNIALESEFSWLAEDPDGDNLTYNFLFGYNSTSLLSLTENETSNSVILTDMDYNTTYYWAITVKDIFGAENNSKIIQFTTLSNGTTNLIDELDNLTEKRSGGLYALFDIKVELGDDSKIVYAGDQIESTIVLYNFGTLKPVDANINCELLDMDNNMYDAFEETLAVETQASIIRSLDIPSTAEPGHYTFHCTLNYEAVEPITSSDLTEVIQQEIHIEQPNQTNKIYLGVLGLVIITTISLFFFIKKKSKQKKKSTKKKRKKKKKK